MRKADIYEKHCAAAYKKRCKMYNLDMSDYSKYNDWSEISVKGDSWKDAYIDLIDEVVGYTVTDYLYGSPYLPCRFLFSLLFLNDDETPELEIDLLLQGEDDRIIYSFDGEKTVFSDCLVENKFVSYYLYKDFILECISDMSECQYTFYNTNDDLKFEEDVTLGYYSTWNEDEGIYEENYSFSTGPDGEEKEISEKEFFSYFEKKGVDPEDLAKSTVECIFSGKYSEMTKYLKDGVKTTSTETEPIEEDYEGTFSEQMQELSKHIIGYIDADDADEIGPMGTRQHIPEYDEDYYNDMLESGFRNSY